MAEVYETLRLEQDEVGTKGEASVVVLSPCAMGCVSPEELEDQVNIENQLVHGISTYHLTARL